MWELMNVTFYKCYISNPKKVITFWDMVLNDFAQLFEPTWRCFCKRIMKDEHHQKQFANPAPYNE
jgi:hypothetical protein